MRGASRRGLLFRAACSFGCAHLAAAQPKGLDCAGVTAPPPLSLDAEARERHEVFLLLAMTLVHDLWGVDRSNPALVAEYAAAEPGRRFADYEGHNIGAVLVDGAGAVVGCGLNRNVKLNNSIAHAEARTIDNAFRLANAAPGGAARWSFGSLLKQHVLYTTLEPCAQCAGILDLANVASVVYGQDDPGQQRIVNVLYNMGTPGHPGAGVLPVRASFVRFWSALASAFERFEAAAAPGQAGATRFLQTVEAYAIYRQAAQEFDTIAVDPANAAALAGARKVRAAWRDALERDGVAPAGAGI